MGCNNPRLSILHIATLLLALSLPNFGHSAFEGTTPLCEKQCKCFNRTATNPDIDCSNNLDAELIMTDPYNFMKNGSTVLYKISSLDLQDCLLGGVITEFPTACIRSLILSHNGLEKIKVGAFKNIHNLTELTLSFNNIHEIEPESFRGVLVEGMDYPLQSLKILRLDNNRIHSLHADVFRHVDRELEELYLQKNPIRVIDLTTHEAIVSILNLKVLNLGNTQIKSIPDNFFHTPKYLNTLILSGNKFEEIPKQLGDCHNLETLYFDNNLISVLTKDTGFPEMPTLKTLHLCNQSNLSRLEDGSLSGLHSLVNLYISDNIKLEMIEPAVLSRHDEFTEIWPRIQKLYLQNNQLTTIDSHLIYRWEDLVDLDIRMNPWTCECENQWLLDELMPVLTKLDLARSKEVFCAAPIEMQGKSMFNLTSKHSQMRCLDMFGNRPERDAKILVGILIGICICVPLILFLLFAYQRQWFGMFDNSPAAFSRQFYGRTTTTEDNMGF